LAGEVDTKLVCEAPDVINTDEEWVSELIDRISYQWRSELVRSIFVAPDADAILQIPLRCSDGEDCIMWHYEMSGMYSVRSAYRALLSEKEAMRETNDNVGGYPVEEDKWMRL
jgi:hypothetical protein